MYCRWFPIYKENDNWDPGNLFCLNWGEYCSASGAREAGKSLECSIVSPIGSELIRSWTGEFFWIFPQYAQEYTISILWVIFAEHHLLYFNLSYITPAVISISGSWTFWCPFIVGQFTPTTCNKAVYVYLMKSRCTDSLWVQNSQEFHRPDWHLNFSWIDQLVSICSTSDHSP